MDIKIDPPEAYHKWYYDTEVWHDVTFLGVPCYKSVSDMWSYQEILADLEPTLIVEFGTRFGGSALYFSMIGRGVNPDLQVLTVDLSHEDVSPKVYLDPAIHLLAGSSAEPAVRVQIQKMRSVFPGKVFFILDSDHRKEHVLAELELLRWVTEPGDYVVVEDGNINGNPVLPGWGDGPFEALQEYIQRYPDDYQVDSAREEKFGFTFSPSGFLIKT